MNRAGKCKHTDWFFPFALQHPSFQFLRFCKLKPMTEHILHLEVQYCALHSLVKGLVIATYDQYCQLC